jgi:hypothetical protein
MDKMTPEIIFKVEKLENGWAVVISLEGDPQKKVVPVEAKSEAIDRAKMIQRNFMVMGTDYPIKQEIEIEPGE